MTAIKTIADLNAAVQKISLELGVPLPRVRTTFVGVITAQMLPNTVAVKGGLAIKMQLGELGTRATSDLDAVLNEDYENTLTQIRERFAMGWGKVPASKRQLRKDQSAPDRVAFTAAITEKSVHDPGVRRPEYLMRPVRVTLNFLEKPWGAIDLELAYPEANAVVSQPKSLNEQLIQTFEGFGFGAIGPVSFLPNEIQIAQKIHALTHPESDRAHDLVDLQLLWTDQVNPTAVKTACEHTFRYRKEHSWPPLPLRSMAADQARYHAALQEILVSDQPITVAQEIATARDWLDSKIRKLLQSHE